MVNWSQIPLCDFVVSNVEFFTVSSALVVLGITLMSGGKLSLKKSSDFKENHIAILNLTEYYYEYHTEFSLNFSGFS